MGYQAEPEDFYCIANDWLMTHRDRVHENGWMAEAVASCKKVYSEIEWDREAVAMLKHELCFLT